MTVVGGYLAQPGHFEGRDRKMAGIVGKPNGIQQKYVCSCSV